MKNCPACGATTMTTLPVKSHTGRLTQVEAFECRECGHITIEGDALPEMTEPQKLIFKWYHSAWHEITARFSCEKIRQLTDLLRDELRLHVAGAEPVRIGPVLDMIDALNQHQVIIDTAVTELSSYAQGAVSAPTLDNLARILRRD